MKKFLILIIMILASTALYGCDMLGDIDTDDIDLPDQTAEPTITIHKNEHYDIANFNLSDITLTVTIDDDTKTIPLSPAMLDSTSLALLDTAGTHTLEGQYQGTNFSFQITLVRYDFNVEAHLNSLAERFDLGSDPITDNLTFPSFNQEAGVTYSYSSSHPEIISDTGVVTRPAHTENARDVIITLMLQMDDIVVYKPQIVVVLPEEAPADDIDLDIYTDFSQVFNTVPLGSEITVKGLITHSIPAGFYLYDGENHLFVFNRRGMIPSPGHIVQVTAELLEWQSMTQLSNVSSVQIVESNQPLPTLESTPITVQGLHDLDHNDPANYGKTFIVEGTLELRGRFFNVNIVDEDYSVVVYYLSPEASIEALEAHVGERVQVEVLYYAQHSTDGLLVIFNQTALDITVIDQDDDDEDEVIFDPEIHYMPDFEAAYDGLRLDPSWLDVTPMEYDTFTGRYRGTGGAFHVGYDPDDFRSRCIDGDTTVFHYPSEIYNLIESNAKSTRYFNIDTPETWPLGAEEEWGATATVYVCAMLERAESIILQTDPGDNLLDRHGRLLGWIWIRMPGDDDYMLLNYLVVRHGLATVEYLFGAGETEHTMYDGLTYTEWMWHAQFLAELDELGIWGDLKEYYYDYDHNRINRNRYPH